MLRSRGPAFDDEEPEMVSPEELPQDSLEPMSYAESLGAGLTGGHNGRTSEL